MRPEAIRACEPARADQRERESESVQRTTAAHGVLPHVDRGRWPSDASTLHTRAEVSRVCEGADVVARNIHARGVAAGAARSAHCRCGAHSVRAHYFPALLRRSVWYRLSYMRADGVRCIVCNLCLAVV